MFTLLSAVCCQPQMYSLAWKAATGVAAAEGLAIGGWSCKNVRTQQAEVDKAAAELSRLRQQAAQELTALRGLLQQQEASHTHEVRECGCWRCCSHFGATACTAVLPVS